jgi:hypothetical protein
VTGTPRQRPPMMRNRFCIARFGIALRAGAVAAGEEDLRVRLMGEAKHKLIPDSSAAARITAPPLSA